MNRTDRLVAMVMYLQGRRLVRAEELARHFEVTVRTVYRDVAALGEAGVPVVGEAGVGYSLVKGYHLPPVMFTGEEATALFLGGEMVKQFTDASLVGPMLSALLKIRSVLPRERQDDVDRLAQSVAIEGRPRPADALEQRVLLPIQRAMLERCVLRLVYHVPDRREDTTREVEPLGVAFFNGAWYLVAWCRMRADFRHFKIERVRGCELTAERFAPRPDFSLHRHLAESAARHEMLPVTVWFSHAAIERARRECCRGFLAERVDATGVETDLMTFSHEWLLRWIFSFAGEAAIRAPESLRESAAQAVSRLAGNHARSPNGTDAVVCDIAADGFSRELARS